MGSEEYGFAPTRIIYLIATRYILGFNPSLRLGQSNFRQVDTVPYAKEGRMEELIEKEFGRAPKGRQSTARGDPPGKGGGQASPEGATEYRQG